MQAPPWVQWPNVPVALVASLLHLCRDSSHLIVEYLDWTCSCASCLRSPIQKQILTAGWPFFEPCFKIQPTGNPAFSADARRLNECPLSTPSVLPSSLRPSLSLTLAQFTKPSSGHLNLSFSPCRLQASLSKRLPSPRK